jgi:hypothetical protein
MKDCITLFSLVRSDINVRIELYFDDAGQLILEGYDMGKTVEEIWGDVDYEYSHIVPAEEVNKFYSLLDLPANDRITLLRTLKKIFGDNSAYTLFGEFMDAHGVKHSSYSWA